MAAETEWEDGARDPRADAPVHGDAGDSVVARLRPRRDPDDLDGYRTSPDRAGFDAEPIAPRVWETVRASMDGRGVRALGAAAAVLVLLTVVAVWWNRPSGTPVPPLPAVASARDGTQPALPESTGAPVVSGGTAVGGAGGGASEQTTAAPASVVVSVVGLVAQPGIVTLGAGARVADALTAAGGPAPNADTLGLNLARPLADGEQIVVGALTAASGPPESAVISGGAAGTAPIAAPAASGMAGAGSAGGAGAGAAGGAPAGGSISLSTATVAELETLPGVGPVTAAAIVQWRTDNGPFASVEQLAEVPGIGPARLAKLQPLVVP